VIPALAEIRVGENETFESALRRFVLGLELDGLLRPGLALARKRARWISRLFVPLPPAVAAAAYFLGWLEAGLTASLGLLLPGTAFLASLTALTGTRRRLSERLELKWPNDLLLGGGKVAGVLVQQCQSGGQTWVVAGVGVNLRWNQPPPDSISAAGLIQSLPKIHREEVLEHLLEAIGQLSSQTVIDADEMAARFNAVHRYQLMSVEFIHKGDRGLPSEGRVQGVSPRGGLLLELPGRGVHEYSLGALSMREPKPA
jgi:biotin-(acetyl-CoA carboxylase) ligase